MIAGMSHPHDPIKPTSLTVGLPFGLGTVEFTPDPTQRRAAFALYVELATRVTTQELGLDDGLLREALSSLHSVIARTREILRDAGPDVGLETGTVGGLAIAVINKGLRPFLGKWHPRLTDWEATRGEGTSVQAHEREWEHEVDLRGELKLLQDNVKKYLSALRVLAVSR